MRCSTAAATLTGCAGEVGNIVRVLSIRDVFAALAEQRSWHGGMRPTQAVQILNEMSGKIDLSFLQTFGEAVVYPEVT